MEGVGNRGLKRTPSYFCKMKGVLEMDGGDDNVNVPDATDCALLTSENSTLTLLWTHSKVMF